MFSRWPIRSKLYLGIVLLMCTVAVLSISGFVGVYAFRRLAKSIRLRAPELPLAAQLTRDVNTLNVSYKLYRQSVEESDFYRYNSTESMELETIIGGLLKHEFQLQRGKVVGSFLLYHDRLKQNHNKDEYRSLGVHADEQAAMKEFENTLDEIKTLSDDLGGDDELLATRLKELDELSTELPQFLHSRMFNFANEVRGQYRTWIAMTAAGAFVAVILLLLALRMFYAWVFRPLEVLLKGSRRVASGDFHYRIHLDSQDEMAELATDMNNMTNRFQEIRDDLDQQVKQRTKEVVRSEQLASVGFLAAGVAHEINNPLASIALCAESLEERVSEIILNDDTKPLDQTADEIAVVNDYLRMIQDEAFRCKEITERLLDFSRLGDVEKQKADLSELVQNVINTVKHLGKYKQKTIHFVANPSVYVPVNTQEMKQVVLNLLTNALDSLDLGGRVNVEIKSGLGQAHIVVTDNGCGMTDEVQRHLFEPFFTRRRGGQGTGLGMSITYRIVNDHGGDIEAHSDGPGKGSTITVSLPMTDHDEKQKQRHKAA